MKYLKKFAGLYHTKNIVKYDDYGQSISEFGVFKLILYRIEANLGPRKLNLVDFDVFKHKPKISLYSLFIGGGNKFPHSIRFTSENFHEARLCFEKKIDFKLKGFI